MTAGARPEGPWYKDFASFKLCGGGRAASEGLSPPRAGCQGEAAPTGRAALAPWKHDEDAWRGESARQRALDGEPPWSFGGGEPGEDCGRAGLERGWKGQGGWGWGQEEAEE